MTILQIEYRVADFDEWMATFDRDPMDREAHGVTGYSIFRRIGDPSHLLVTLDFDTAEHAQAFREALRPVWEISGAGRSWVIDG